MNRGKYIVIEGPEGVGKTTQLAELARRLQAAGLPVRQLREPDSQSDLTARAIRQLTQDPRYPMNTRAEVLLYNAARTQSLQVIKQSVEHGVICLVDRNYLTTLAIQYYGRGDVPDYEAINAIINFAVGGMEPDLCVVLDAPVPTLRERLKDRYNGERFDNLDDAFLERVRAGYLWEARQRGLPVIFATQQLAEVADSVWKLVSSVLAIREPRQAASAITPPASVKEIIAQKNLPPPPVTMNVAAAPDSQSSDSMADDAPTPPADTVQVFIEEVSFLLAASLGGQRALLQPLAYYAPSSLKPDLARRYQTTMDKLLANYKTMLRKLTTHLQNGTAAPAAAERGRAWQIATQTQAADCLRTVLPLATLSTVDLLVPKLKLDSLIATLTAQPLAEAQQLGHSLHEQGYEGTPLMLEDGRVVDGVEALSTYHQETAEQLRTLVREHLTDTYPQTVEPVKLVDFWPKNELNLVPDMLYAYSNLPLEELQTAVSSWPYTRKTEVFEAYIGRRKSPRQQPGNALNKAHYSWDLVTDFGSFLDVQPHLAADELSRQPASPRDGYDLPALVETAGLTELFEACFDLSLKLYSQLQQAGYPLEAQYATLVGHKIRWEATCNAGMAFRLLEAPYDQPTTVALTAAMHEKLAEVHPLLAASIAFVAGLPLDS